MTPQPKVLMIRVDADDSNTTVKIEFGAKEIVRDIPIGHGISRVSVILDESNALQGVEVVTVKAT